MAADIGKVFERELARVFKLLKADRLVGWHRLVDTGTSGGMVAEQPSDYLLALPPGCQNLLNGQRMMFVEAKASEKSSTLPKANVKSPQRAAIAHYRHILKLPYYILFWDTQSGCIELWDGAAITEAARLDKSCRLAVWPDCGVINKLRTEHVAACIVSYFVIPLGGDTLSLT